MQSPLLCGFVEAEDKVDQRKVISVETLSSFAWAKRSYSLVFPPVRSIVMCSLVENFDSRGGYFVTFVL